jgi:5-methylcytosine-specific restriction enzyme A
MPTASPKPCTQCGVLVRDGSSRCAAHQRPAWFRPVPSYKRESGRRLQRKRAELFAREPLCRECDSHGRVSVATIRDHIKPLEEGGTDDDANVQPLCQVCSDAKTKSEAARGRHRYRG